MGKFTTFGMQQEHKQQSDESDESEDELAINKKKEEEEEEDLILGPDDSEIKNTTSHIKHQIGQVAVTFRRIRIPDLLSTHDDLDPDTFRVLSRLSISSVTPAHLLRAVLAMAVRDWVFYSDVLAKMFGTDSRAYRAQTWCVYIRGEFNRFTSYISSTYLLKCHVLSCVYTRYVCAVHPYDYSDMTIFP